MNRKLNPQQSFASKNLPNFKVPTIDEYVTSLLEEINSSIIGDGGDENKKPSLENVARQLKLSYKPELIGDIRGEYGGWSSSLRRRRLIGKKIHADVYSKYKLYLEVINSEEGIRSDREERLELAFFHPDNLFDPRFDELREQVADIGGFYCAMASAYGLANDPLRALHYVAKAYEISGLVYRVCYEEAEVEIAADMGAIYSAARVDTAVKDLNSKSMSDRRNKRRSDIPKQAEKAYVKKCYEDWLEEEEIYKDMAEFVRLMQRDCKYLKCNRSTIESWIKKGWQ